MADDAPEAKAPPSEALRRILSLLPHCTAAELGWLKLHGILPEQRKKLGVANTPFDPAKADQAVAAAMRGRA